MPRESYLRGSSHNAVRGASSSVRAAAAAAAAAGRLLVQVTNETVRCTCNVDAAPSFFSSSDKRNENGGFYRKKTLL